jgi:2-keto-3-deoxy-L-rhamnonate aldolase RhmA
MLGRMIMVAKYPPSGQRVGGSKGERAQQQQDNKNMCKACIPKI